VDVAGVVRPLFRMLQAVLERHGANVSSDLPPQPPVAAYGAVVMTQRVPLWRALPALALHPVRSDTVRTMEELNQGYGYILYSAPVPQFEARAKVGSVALAGMRDRALVYFDRELHQTCHRGTAVDSVVCSAAANATVHHANHLDVLVENQGRVTGGLVGTELPWRGISRYVALNNQILANWTITPLPLNDTELLASLWSGGDADRVDGPAFFRGGFSIGAGEVADTFLTLLGWQKGVAFVNGHNLARYTRRGSKARAHYHFLCTTAHPLYTRFAGIFGASVSEAAMRPDPRQGPQFGFYCPAGWLREGPNEVMPPPPSRFGPPGTVLGAHKTFTILSCRSLPMQTCLGPRRHSLGARIASAGDPVRDRRRAREPHGGAQGGADVHRAAEPTAAAFAATGLPRRLHRPRPRPVVQPLAVRLARQERLQGGRRQRDPRRLRAEVRPDAGLPGV
jgi:hypothetical protein